MPEKPDRKRVLKSRNESVKKIAAKNLIPDPLNWHTHGAEQREALGKIFEEVGFVGFVLVRKSSQRGKYHIIDGHERVAMITERFGPNELVDCSVLDLTEDEAKKILATHDSIGSMGGVDDALLAELMESVKFDDEDLQRIVNGALTFSDEALKAHETQSADTVSEVADGVSERTNEQPEAKAGKCSKCGAVLAETSK